MCLSPAFGSKRQKKSHISRRVSREIQRKLALASAPDRQDLFEPAPEIDSEALRQQIATRVKNTLNKQVFLTLNETAKEEVYNNKGKNKKDGCLRQFIYKDPEWPRYSQVFIKRDLVGIDFSLKFATQAYGSSGSTRDISNLVFQEDPIYLKDILLASKLLDEGYAETTTDKYKFLDILKDQEIKFDSSMEEQVLKFSYIRHFLRGDILFGIQVPLVRKVHNIKLVSSLTPQVNEQLTDESTGFFTTYPNGFSDFFEDVLSKKDLHLNNSDAEVGVGDVGIFASYEVPSVHFERAFVGAHLLLPTSRKRDIFKLWDPELGNGGFTELSMLGTLLSSHSRWFNLHFLMQATYAFPAKVFRRVPKKTSSDDIENLTSAKLRYGEDFLLYGNGVKYPSSEPEFSRFDTTVRRFADSYKKIKIHRGGSFTLRVGNISERIFTKRIFLDLFYDLYAKWRDYAGFRRVDDEYDPSIVVKNSYEMRHRLAMTFDWQPDDSWRVDLGGLYTFAGRNTPRVFEVKMSASLQF